MMMMTASNGYDDPGEALRGTTAAEARLALIAITTRVLRKRTWLKITMFGLVRSGEETAPVAHQS